VEALEVYVVVNGATDKDGFDKMRHLAEIYMATKSNRKRSPLDLWKIFRLNLALLLFFLFKEKFGSVYVENTQA